MGLFNRRKKFKPTEQYLADMEQVKQALSQMKAAMPPEIIEAHEHCRNNRKEIGKSKMCGCIYCLETFPSNEVVDWVGKEATKAICPRCGVDSVLGDAAGFELSSEFLGAMRKHWF